MKDEYDFTGAERGRFWKPPDPDHQVWWIFSPADEPWAGLQIAHFSKTRNGVDVVVIPADAALDPGRFGVRVWADIAPREGWVKVKRIDAPTADEIKAAR